MPLLPEFSHRVDLTKVPADDVLRIVEELVNIGNSMDSIPRNGDLWDSLRDHPMGFRVKNWAVRYVVDERHERLTIVDVFRV